MKQINSILSLLSALLIISIGNSSRAQETQKHSEEFRNNGGLYNQSMLYAASHNFGLETPTSLNRLFKTVPLPNVEAHALWALGVQIGFAELGSNRNVETSLLQESLSIAVDLANMLDCLPRSLVDRIAELSRKMRSASSSSTLYSEILALRMDMADVVNSSCLCDGGRDIDPPPVTWKCSPSDWEGIWSTNYNTMSLTLMKDGRLSGYYNTAKHRLSGRPIAGNPCILVGRWDHATGSSWGRFRFELTENGKFKGKWTYGDKTPLDGGSNWTGKK
jgi:hypothetical protein